MAREPTTQTERKPQREILSVQVAEDAIAALYGRDPQSGAAIADIGLDALVSAAQVGRKHAEQLVALRDALAADPSQSAGAKAIKLRQTASDLGVACAKKFDQARAKANSELLALRKATSSPARPVGASEAQEVEVRSVLRGLSPAERNQILHAAIMNGDNLTVRSVLGAPAWLSGLTHNEWQGRVLQWRRHEHPKSVQREERLVRGIETIDRAWNSFAEFVQAVAGPDAARAAEAAERVQKLSKIEVEGATP